MWFFRKWGLFGTIYIIGLTMALVGEFCLMKPKPALER